MTNNPRRPSPPAPVVDDVRNREEMDTNAEKTDAGMERNAGTSSLHGRVKQHAHDDSDPVQDASVDPVIEDEP